MNDHREKASAPRAENDAKTEKERRQDAFWDLDTILPRSSGNPVYEAAAPRDTEPVEITAGHDDDTGAEEVRIPPMPNLTSRMQRAASYRAENRTKAEASRRTLQTPGDVRPQMAEPVLSYCPENSLLQNVEIFRWPERYQYYERFTADAERYYNRAAKECPYVNFFAYMPQYAAMSQEQLHWYLFWRDNVRHGTYLETDYSYLFLYVYEIINLPDKIAPQDGLSILCDLWLAYRKAYPRLDRYFGEWVCDYCLIYRLPAPIERLHDILPSLVPTLTFPEFYIAFDTKGDCPITEQLCDVLTGNAWRQREHRYLTDETRPIFEKHLYAAVLGALSRAWETNPDFVSLLGFSEVQQSRNAFSGALCTYACKRRIDVTYLSLSRSYQLKFILGDMFKLAENGVRAHLGIKSRLTISGLPEELRECIRSYFQENLPPPKKPERPAAAASGAKPRKTAQNEQENEYDAYYEPLSTTLSPENALLLEQDSWANTELLVAENEDAAQDTDTPSDPSEGIDSPTSVDSQPEESPAPQAEMEASNADIVRDDPYEAFVYHLSSVYYAALKHIICCDADAFRALCAEHSLLPDAVADAINEAAVTDTGDTVLDADGSFWILSDFYANDVMNAVVVREEDA